MALIPSAHVSMAFAEAAATFGIALSATLSVFHWIVGLAWPQAAIPAVTLAAIATLSAPAAIDAFARKGLGPSRLFPVLQLTARVDALIGVTAFGLVLAILHQGDVARSVRPPTATEWAVINIAIGVASGVLFHLFLGPREEAGSDDDRARLFVALAGTIVIASGASYYLNLSPIFTSMVLGFILANTGKAHRDVSRLLETTERPVYLMLLIFAGAAWSPGSPTLLFVVPAFIAVRLVAKLAGGWVGGRVAASQELDTPNMGSALLALGGLGVAIAVNYSQVHPDLAANAVLTATLVAVLLFETVASTGTLAILKESMPPDVEDSPARSVWEISGGLPPPTPAPPPPPDVPPSPESPAP
jgi:Kef-type K+ transport system membrane component KefB